MVLLTLSLFACVAAESFGQIQTVLVNPQGATAPCTGIGPIAAPVVKKCIELFQQAGFIEQKELGYTGLTIGTTGTDDGAIVAIAPQSPAASAGLKVGDVITAVASKPTVLTPGMIASKAVFGQRGEKLSLKLMRSGSEVDLSFARDSADAPKGPTASGFMLSVKDMINWQGQFVPCIGAGPAAIAALEYCYGHFGPFGFIKSANFGAAGFQLDLTRQDKAIVTTVNSGSGAAKAGLQPGDEIVAVDGKTLAASVGQAATEQLFGKVGDTLAVSVRRGQSGQTAQLTLIAKPKS
jgi:S1-C subfamily serine protease